ncbi:hypothetical protein I551_7915 [Mycobacterium ulcerans str. Harvey]|uniref:Uncharacterized protein n=1 Tax=Mycobacterium ulcerans str. Harvey TaxID=1299332 RepID=A0ABN0QMA4_MYCUL|nr:hypothetical protein I551_7915 [Mycobacterium ulcerans str. Harvey]
MRQIGLNDPGRPAVKQDVVGVNVETANIAALVGRDGIAQERPVQDARRPGVLQIGARPVRLALGGRAYEHKVAELQPRHQLWVVRARRGHLQNAQLNGLLSTDASSATRKFDSASG